MLHRDSGRRSAVCSRPVSSRPAPASSAAPQVERFFKENTDRKRRKPGVIRTHDQGMMRTKDRPHKTTVKTTLSSFRPWLPKVVDKVPQSPAVSDKCPACVRHVSDMCPTCVRSGGWAYAQPLFAIPFRSAAVGEWRQVFDPKRRTSLPGSEGETTRSGWFSPA